MIVGLLLFAFVKWAASCMWHSVTMTSIWHRESVWIGDAAMAPRQAGAALGKYGKNT